MADEPRRSGRATKGQHTKMDSPEAAPPEPKKTKQKAKAAKKSAEPEPEEDDSEEIIRCICGNQTDEGGRMMVCCDNCNAWQHNDCMGVTEVEAELPENYLCELCAPDDHRPLLDAIARGEKPWEDIAQKKQGKKKGRKSKAGRPSLKSEAAAAEEPEAQAPPPPPPAADNSNSNNNKRKHEPDPDPPASKSRKSDSASRTGPKAPAKEPLALVNTIADLFPDSRRNVAASLRKKLSPLISNAVSKGAWKLGRGKTVESESERFALLVEYGLFVNHCGSKPDFSGPYKQQLLRILSNIEKNELMVAQLLNGQLSADSLATMTSEEMASDEHRQKMLEMKLEVEKQSILLHDDSAPKMRRTHKGDEIIDDASNDFTSESIMPAPVRRRESELEPQSPAEQNGGAGSPRQSFDATRRPSSFARSPDPPHGARREPDAANAPAATRFKEDPNIDNLLGDDGKDEDDYEPADLQPVSWRGPVTMSSHGLSRVLSARLVAGSDLLRRIEQRAISSLGDTFPQSLTIGGRIESRRADDYLSSLSQSPSTDVSVFTLAPDVANDAGFDDIYNYFHSRQRYAVIDVASTRHLSMVRDFYLAPLPAGTQTPHFLERLHRNDLPTNRPRKLLLAVVVCKWATTLDGAQSTPTATGQPVMSPTAPQPQANTPQAAGVQGAQAGAHGSQYQQNQQYSMPMHPSPAVPSNPYEAPQQQQQQQQSPHPAPGSKEALAYDILGPLVNTHVARAVLAQQSVDPAQLHNLKRILERHPAAREDFALFSQVLSENPA